VTFLVTIQKGVMKMIKKTFDKYSLSQEKKDALFDRINMSVTNTATEQAEEKAENKTGFMRYAAIAASIVLLTGITMLIIHFATPGQQIDVSTPQNNVFESNIPSIPETESGSTNNKNPKPEMIDALSLPFYKDSAVMDMEPQKYGSEGMEQVRFAEVISNANDYRYIVAGDFIRREEDRYEARFNLYIYKGKELIGVPGGFDIGGQSGFDVTKEDMEQFQNKLIKVYSVWQDDKIYPLIMLTHKVNKRVLADLFNSEDYEYGTIFFSVKDDQAFRFTLNGNFNLCYPDFEMESFSKNVYTDKNGWVTQFDFENKTAYVDAVFYDDEKQEHLDNLLPFEDSNIPVYDGFLGDISNVPYAKVVVDEKTIGDYTFTLTGKFVKRSDNVDNYFGGFGIIVSKNKRALNSVFIAPVNFGQQYGISVPKDYNYKDMLKCYMMKQNGIDYPLASVTYNIPDEKTKESLDADSITSFYTVRYGRGESIYGVINYKNLPSDVEQVGLSLKDSVNRKKITFDFENIKGTVTELNNEADVDIKKRPLYTDSHIYTEPYETVKGDFDIVRFAEKSYNKYDFVVGGKMERTEEGDYTVSLNMYLYEHNKLIDMQNALSNGGFDFTVSADDIESFGDAVLDVKEFQYFGTPFPLAVVTAKPHSSILEDDFPSAGFTTVSNFFSVRYSQNLVETGPQLILFSGSMLYPDYTKNVTFRESENNSGMTVMVDEKGWEVFFNPEIRTAYITANKAFNVGISIEGDEYKNKKLIIGKYPSGDNATTFTTDSNGKARFDVLPCDTYIITDENGKNIIDDKSESITITFDNSKTEMTVKGISKEDKSRDVLSFPPYEDSKLFGEDKYNTGVSERVRFAEVTYGEYRFIAAGELTRTTTDYYTARPRVYVYKGKELMKDFGEFYTGAKDGSVKILVQDAKKFTDNMLSVKTMTQNGKEYPLVILAVKGNGIDNYNRITKLYPMDRDYTIPAFYSITDSGVPGMPYQFTGYDDINLYSPVLDNNIIIKDNAVTDGKEWTVAFDFEKRTASVIPAKVRNINITFKGNVSYGNKNFYLQEYTLTDKEKEIIHFTTDSNGKAHFDELPCLTYNIFDEQGNIVSADPHGVVFRVFESNLESVWSLNLPGDNDAVAENLTIQFTGDSSYTNRGLLYLIKTDKAFLDSTDKLTYTDKDLSVVPSYSVSADGKVVIDKADVGYYIVTGPMFLPTNDNGFTVFEVTNKDSYKTINVTLNKADIGSDRVGTNAPDSGSPWIEEENEYCTQDISFMGEKYCAISVDVKWDNLKNGGGTVPVKISGDKYDEEIHRAKRQLFSEYSEIYYNGVLYRKDEVFDNFLIRKVKPKNQNKYYIPVLYIKKSLKTEGNVVYAGSGVIPSVGNDLKMTDIKLKIDGFEKNKTVKDVRIYLLNELEVYLHQNGLDVDGYTDSFHDYNCIGGFSINEKGEFVVPDGWDSYIPSGYYAIGIVYDGDNGGYIVDHPVYYIDSDGNSEFKFRIEKDMYV